MRRAFGVALVAALGWCVASAGPQQEEPLSDTVRGALRAAVAGAGEPPSLVFSDRAHQRRYQSWLDRTEQRLMARIPEPLARQDFLQTLWYEAQRAGLQPSLVLGVVQVESAFRKHAISHAGARGLMQVMPFWSNLIGDGDALTLFHTQVNLRFGCTILRHYLDVEAGNLDMALGRYNGSRGQNAYPKAVRAASQGWVVGED